MFHWKSFDTLYKHARLFFAGNIWIKTICGEGEKLKKSNSGFCAQAYAIMQNVIYLTVLIKDFVELKNV